MMKVTYETHDEWDYKIYNFKAKLHKKVLLYKGNLIDHIQVKHPESTVERINLTLEDPDYIFTSSKRSKDYYYERQFDDACFRVVLAKQKKGYKVVVTAYNLFDNSDAFSVKRIYCVYDRKEEHEKQERKFQNCNSNFYYDLFGIALEE